MAYKKTISDTTRAYVLFLGKEKRYSCRAIAKKARISKASVSEIMGKHLFRYLVNLNFLIKAEHVINT